MAGTQQTLWRRGYMTDTRLSLAAAAASTKEQLRSNRILIKHSYVLGKQGRSMSNHPEKMEIDTLTSQIFFKLSPVVGIIKTRQS